MFGIHKNRPAPRDDKEMQITWSNYEYFELARSAYVREGHVTLRVLGRKGISALIPDGESAITSLAVAPNGRLYGGTSGKAAHLFTYHAGPQADHIIDIGTIDDEEMVYHSLCAAADGRIFGGTMSLKKEAYEGGRLFVYNLVEDFSHQFLYNVGDIEVLTVPVTGEGITCLTIDNRRGCLYGLTHPSGRLFSYDIASGKVNDYGKVGKDDFSRTLVVSREGVVYGGSDQGRLFKFDPDRGQLEMLSVCAPAVAGHEYFNIIDSLALDERTGLIYGGTQVDGMLFVLDPAADTVRCLGKPSWEIRVRGLTVGKDGMVYGVAGNDGGLAHLFRYDPLRHEHKDLGIVTATVQRWWIAYEFDSMATGPFGEIYLGESDRISHLFIYHPPVQTRAGSYGLPCAVAPTDPQGGKAAL